MHIKYMQIVTGGRNEKKNIQLIEQGSSNGNLQFESFFL